MKSLTKSFVIFFLFSLLFPAVLISQSFENFEKSVLVDLPGYNYDFDLLSNGVMYPIDDLYITWVNKTDSIYTIYLKKISPESIDSNISIAADNNIKLNPQVAYNSSGPGITVLWENFTDGVYQIMRNDYVNGSVSDQVILMDSLSSDPQITMNYNHLAWVTDENLFYKELYPETGSTSLIDSPGCALPSLRTDDAWTGKQSLIYEKLVNGNRRIYLAELNSYPNPHWIYYELSGGDNRNPEFGAGGGFSFESIQGGVSRIKYLPYYDPESDFLTSNNTGCNYKNPDVFSYPIPTDQQDTPFFIAFDTDSIENNNEVFIQTFFSGSDQLINLSDMEGDDLKPKADVSAVNEVNYLVIVWEHHSEAGSTIWMAKTLFQRAGGIKDDDINLSSFDLLQNYPNPFNPATSIEYSLRQGTNVKVAVFDILGNRIAVLADGYEYAGRHKVVFDGKNLSSGVYFCTLEVNSLQKTKAMILLR